jgi:hypothetical protein
VYTLATHGDCVRGDAESCSFALPDGKLIREILTAVKSEFAKQLLAKLRAGNSAVLGKLKVTRRDGTTRYRVWQVGGGYDRNLFSPAAIKAAIEYIHGNPGPKRVV